MQDAGTLKKLLDCKDASHRASATSSDLDASSPSSIAIKELVTDANFECNEEGLVCHICAPVPHA